MSPYVYDAGCIAIRGWAPCETKKLTFIWRKHLSHWKANRLEKLCISMP